MNIDYSKITNVVVEGIDTKDAPDFCDAYISSADYDGDEMSDEMLEELSDDFIHEQVISEIY